MIHLQVSYLGRSTVRATPDGYSEACRTQMFAIPGIQWDKPTKSYTGPVEAVKIAATLLEAAGVVQVSWSTASSSSYDISYGTKWAANAELLPRHLRDYQKHGVGWVLDALKHTGGALLADDMGLGKTPQAIAIADIAASTGHRLVICPAIAVAHWRKQIALWGIPADIDTWHIFSYAGFRNAVAKGDGKLLSHFAPRLIVLDEGQALCNPGAKQTAAVRDYISDLPQRPPALALTGTPMTARVSDMWSLLDILHPGRWGSKWQFERRYADGRYVEIPAIGKSVWKADGSSHLAELHHRLQHVMLRRLKADVATELPPRTRVMLDVEMPRSAAREAKKIAKGMAITVSDDTAAVARFNGVGDLLATAESHKIEAAIELARDVMASGHRPLILTLRKATAATIGQALMAPVVDGDTSATSRRDILLSGTAGVATIYSVTTAIDLTEFDTLIFVGIDWVPSTIQQAEARIHRIGSERPVTIYYLIGVGTIDEVVRERVIDRLDTFDTAVGDASGGMATTLKGGTEDELLNALALAVMQ